MHTAPAHQLAPAARIVQRYDGLLQVGIRPEACVQVSDTPATRQALSDLSRGDVLTGAQPDLLIALDDAGLVAQPQQGLFGVRLIGDLALDLSPALRWAGLTERPTASLALCLSVGELDRTELDPLIRAGIPHLMVRAVDGVLIVGPFVDPGHTACLRCIDAHHADDDPGYRRALDAYITNRTLPREDGLVDMVRSSDAALALAWAARDLRAFSLAQTPSTWSTTITIGDHAFPISATTWEPHPSCGCRWTDPAAVVA